MTTHVRGKHHKDMAKASSTSKSVASLFYHNFNYIHYNIMIFIPFKLVGAVCP